MLPPLVAALLQVDKKKKKFVSLDIQITSTTVSIIYRSGILLNI